MRFVLVVILLLAAGCRSASPPSPEPALQAAHIALSIDPQPPTVGDASLTVIVTRDGQPLADAKVDIRGDMTHAGMQPEIVNAVTDIDGDIALPFHWSMSGDWIVTITVTLADGSQIAQEFPVSVEP